MLLQQFRSTTNGSIADQEEEDQSNVHVPTIESQASSSSSKSDAPPPIPPPAIWIDLENVRGKSGFELTHQQVLDRTALWIDYHQLHNNVIIVADHGATSAGYFLPQHGMAVVFAGDDSRPPIKADDVIANGVSLFGLTLVVTADNELRARCRRSAQSTFHLIDPQRFLDDLEYVSNLKRQDNSINNNNVDMNNDDRLSLNDEIKLGKLDVEIKLRGQLLEAEIQLDKKGKSMTNKRRKKLQSRIQSLRKKLAMRGPSLLERITSLDNNNDSNDDDSSEISRDQQDMILARWRELQHSPMRKERTGDRVIYAERLSREMDDNENAILLEPDDERVLEFNAENGSSFMPASLAFAVHVNTVGVSVGRATNRRPLSVAVTNGASESEIDDEPLEEVEPPELSTQQRLDYDNSNKLETIDVVCISDTHGFERQLDLPLPDGDVLLHLGDFALEGSHESEYRGLQAFDVWLAKQPHPYKIVLRGNHDPWTVDFVKSKALYVNRPRTINVGGFEMALIPHSSARKMASSGGMPPACDLMASHLPPFKTLDRTYSGKLAGSNYLTSFVRGMVKPPKVWLVGHIHEGRGVANRQFGNRKTSETTVINCSNANSGRATHLTHGPVLLRMTSDSDVDIVQMDDKTINQPASRAKFFEGRDGTLHRGLLLAVDLGLKSGISLFSEDGRLVRYEQFLFTREKLHESITNIVREWEDGINKDLIPADCSWKITHVAVEGGDTSLLSTWSQALPNMSILRVSPEEWRSELLTVKERQSGSSSKAASRLIARQIVDDFGSMDLHQGKFPTDVAESVLLGLYCSIRLGWITRSPAIRRYTNGNVVTPKKISQVQKGVIYA